MDGSRKGSKKNRWEFKPEINMSDPGQGKAGELFLRYKGGRKLNDQYFYIRMDQGIQKNLHFTRNSARGERIKKYDLRKFKEKKQDNFCFIQLKIIR